MIRSSKRSLSLSFSNQNPVFIFLLYYEPHAPLISSTIGKYTFGTRASPLQTLSTMYNILLPTNSTLLTADIFLSNIEYPAPTWWFSLPC
jgi:hypothetical protein